MTYVNPTSVMAVGVIFPVLGVIAVILRFTLRHKRKTGLALDDWLCVPALILVWAEGGLMIAGAATHSFGWHSPLYNNQMDFLNDDEASVKMLGKLQTAFDLIHPATLACIKLSIILFYRRIFRGQKFDILSWAIIVIIILWAIAFTTAIAAACRTNFDANWASLLALKEKCIDTFHLLLAYGISDVVVDVILVVMPIPLIFNLHTSLQRKLAICAIMIIGTLAIGCGITRLVIFVEVSAPSLLANSRVAGLLATDDLGVVSLVIFWGMVEIGVGMIAICLPTLRPLMSGISPESIIRSIRSVISLRSLHSSGSRSPKVATKDMYRVGSEVSTEGINLENMSYPPIPKVGAENNVCATRGSEDSFQIPRAGKGSIRVDREFEMGH